MIDGVTEDEELEDVCSTHVIYRDTKAKGARPCTSEVWDYQWCKYVEGAGTLPRLDLSDNILHQVDLVNLLREKYSGSGQNRWIPARSSAKYGRFCNYMWILYLTFRHSSRDLRLQFVNERMEEISEKEKQEILEEWSREEEDRKKKKNKNKKEEVEEEKEKEEEEEEEEEGEEEEEEQEDEDVDMAEKGTQRILPMGVFAERRIRRGEVVRITAAIKMEKMRKKEVLERRKKHQSLAQLSFLGSVPGKGGKRKRQKITRFGRLIGGASYINSGHEECCNIYPVYTRKDYDIFLKSPNLAGFRLSRSRRWGMWVTRREIRKNSQLSFFYGTSFKMTNDSFKCVVCSKQ